MARRVTPQKKWTFTILAWLVALIMFFPILWTFLTAFKKTYKVKTLQAYTAFGGEAMQVLMAAIAKSNGTRAGVVKSLYNLTVPKSILGPATIDKFGDPVYGDTSQSQVTIQNISGGNINTVIVEKPSADLVAKAAG